MHTADFDYQLPDELIAQRPLAAREQARLLVLSASGREHRHIADLPDLLDAQDLLVVNDTKVVKARMRGHKETGGGVEFLLERLLDERCVLAQLRSSRAPRAGARLRFGEYSAQVTGRDERFFVLRFDADVQQVLQELGEVPLPPYIERAVDAQDDTDYQTPFAQSPGAVAAPTAGLHFGPALLARLAERGQRMTSVTLHVGAGTFTPVQTPRLQEHRMHAERLSVPRACWDEIEATRQRGGRVVAVGTTVVRALESAALDPQANVTDLFITPGYEFRVVDGLFTNFHLPQSTLLMLVSAFAGRSRVLDAYREAVCERYRFFSYGDAMFIPQRCAPEVAAL